MGRRRKFEYKKRDKASVEKRANQSQFDNLGFLPDDVAFFVPKDGDNLLRILPPTWDDPDHYGYDLHVHYQVGPDKSNFLCLHKMKGEADPIEEERARLEAEGEEEKAKALKATKRVGAWVIDRDEEEKGPQFWAMPWTIDRDFSTLAVDKRSGEVLNIDDPEDGYDIEFTKKGKGRSTEYTGMQVARRESSLTDDDEQYDEWIEYIQEHPIPDVLLYHDYDVIAKHFGGGAYLDKRKDDDDKGKGKKDKDDDGKEEKSSRRSRKEKKEVSVEDLKEMDMDALDKYCEENNVDLFGDDFKDEDDFLEAICKEQGFDLEDPSEPESEEEEEEEDAPEEEEEKEEKGKGRGKRLRRRLKD